MARCSTCKPREFHLRPIPRTGEKEGEECHIPVTPELELQRMGVVWGPVDPHGQPNLLSELLASKRSPLKGKLHEQEGKLWTALKAFKSTHTPTCTHAHRVKTINPYLATAIEPLN